VKSALSGLVGISLILIAPGPDAWAQVARVAGAADSFSAAQAVPSGAASLIPVATTTRMDLLPVPSLTALSPVLTFSSPSLAAVVAPANPAVEAAAPTASITIPLPAAATESLNDDSPGSSVASPAAAPGVSAWRSSSAAPTVRTLDRLRRQIPDLSTLSFDGARDAATAGLPPRVEESPRLSRGRTDSGRSALVPSIPRATVVSVARSGAVPLSAVAAAFALSFVPGGAFGQSLLILPLLQISFILHEIGHAKVAHALGDPTAMLEGRARLNPFHWLKHVDFNMTVLIPLATLISTHGAFLIGGAKPVAVVGGYFKHPVKDMAKAALAGPAVNVVLAALGALANAGAIAAHLAAPVSEILTHFVFINVLLATFNLVPLRPLDGYHVLAYAAPRLSARLNRLYAGLDALFAAMAADVSAALGRRFSPQVAAPVVRAIESGGSFLPVAFFFLLSGGVLSAVSLGLSHRLIEAALSLK
jgi:Zn-dependent protease